MSIIIVNHVILTMSYTLGCIYKAFILIKWGSTVEFIRQLQKPTFSSFLNAAFTFYKS